MKRKERILQAAIELFAQKGFDGTTTLDIARTADINEPLIFYYFKSKANLYLRIVENTFDAYSNKLDELEQTESTAFDKIKNIIHMLELAAEMPDAIRIILSTMPAPAKLSDPDGICKERYTKAGTRMRRLLRKTVEEGIAEGQFRKMDVDQTVNVLSALISGLLRQRVFELSDDRGIEASAVDFCKAALLKK